MTAPTIAPETVCGCGRRYSSHYADQGRMRGADCPDFHVTCTAACRHPVLRARATAAAATQIQLAPREPGARSHRHARPDAEIPARLREEPLPPIEPEEERRAPETPTPPAAAPPAAAEDGPGGFAAAVEVATSRILNPPVAESSPVAGPAAAGDGAPAAAPPRDDVKRRYRALADAFVEQLRAKRIERGLSQVEVARRAGTALSYVNMLEKRSSEAGVPILGVWADVVGLELDVRLVDRDAPRPVFVEQLRAVAHEMYESWHCPRCQSRRYTPSRCCGVRLDPIWVAIIPREVNP